MIFGFVLAALLVAAIFLAPKPNIENAKAGVLGDFKIPRIDEGTPKQLVYGTARIDGPVMLSYGHLRTVRIREKVKVGLFKKKKITVGYQYYLGMQFGLCLGRDVPSGEPVRLRGVWVGNKKVFSGDQGTDGANFTISNPNLFGGYKDGGGISSGCTWYTGSWTQSIDTYVNGFLTANAPAYRGLAYFVWRGGLIGESTNIRQFAFEVSYVPNGLGLPIPADTYSCNPCEALYDIFTNGWGRLGRDPTLINTSNFVAVGNVLHSELNYVNGKIENPIQAKQFINEVLNQIDGILYENMVSGQINIKLIRDDYVVGGLPVFDEVDISKVNNFDAKMWEDTINEARVVFTSRTEEYKDKGAFAQDGASISATGVKKTVTHNFPLCNNATLANQLAARELQFSGTPLIQAQLVTNRRGATLAPGDVFVWNWDEYQISDAVMRVLKVETGDLENNRVIIDCIQDKFSTSESVYAEPPDSEFVAPELDPIAVPAASQKYFIMNGFFVQASIGAAQLATKGDYGVMILAENPGGAVATYTIEYSLDNGVTWINEEVDNDFVVTGLLTAAITEHENALATFNTTQSLTIDNINGDMTDILTVSGTAAREQGRTLILLGDPEGTYEVMAYDTITDNLDGTYTLNNCWRGLLDTSTQDHADNTKVYFIGYLGLDSAIDAKFIEGDLIRYRLITKSGLLRLDPADATVSANFTMTNKSVTPNPVNNLRLDGGVDHNLAGNPTATDLQFGVTWKGEPRFAQFITSPNIGYGDYQIGILDGFDSSANVSYDLSQVGVSVKLYRNGGLLAAATSGLAGIVALGDGAYTFNDLEDVAHFPGETWNTGDIFEARVSLALYTDPGFNNLLTYIPSLTDINVASIEYTGPNVTNGT